MRPRRSLTAWILVAMAVHALVLLLPRPAGRAGEGVPTIELTLEEAGPGPAGQAEQPGGPAPAAAREAAAPATAAQAAAAAAEPTATELSTPAEETAAESAPAEDTASAAEPGVAAVPGPEAVSAAPAAGAGASVTGGAGGAALAGSTAAGAGGAEGTADTAAGALTPPRPRTQISPAYPRSARAAGAQGIVRITALIDSAGTVINAEVSSSSGTAALDRAALEEVRRTVFQPAVQRGKPVPCRLIIPVRFRLN
jgi:periplasmic protein TonB